MPFKGLYIEGEWIISSLFAKMLVLLAALVLEIPSNWQVTRVR
jgi:hypothetical protein